MADLYQKRALESLGSVLSLVSVVEKRFMGWFPVVDRSLQDDQEKAKIVNAGQAPFTLALRAFASQPLAKLDQPVTNHDREQSGCAVVHARAAIFVNPRVTICNIKKLMLTGPARSAIFVMPTGINPNATRHSTDPILPC
jgi:hypothetical protein